MNYKFLDITGLGVLINKLKTVFVSSSQVATTNTLGLIKSGTDITVDSNGNVTVNDDSHNHTIENIDNLQNTLNLKKTIVVSEVDPQTLNEGDFWMEVISGLT